MIKLNIKPNLQWSLKYATIFVNVVGKAGMTNRQVILDRPESTSMMALMDSAFEGVSVVGNFDKLHNSGYNESQQILTMVRTTTKETLMATRRMLTGQQELRLSMSVTSQTTRQLPPGSSVQ